MTREEEIKLASEEVLGTVEYQCGFADGARWADKTMIKKACEIYRQELLQFNNLLVRINKEYDGLIDIEKSVNSFKKAMEE